MEYINQLITSISGMNLGMNLYEFFLKNIESPLIAFSNNALYGEAMSEMSLEEWRNKLNKVKQSVNRLSENPEFIKSCTEYKSSVNIDRTN